MSNRFETCFKCTHLDGSPITMPGVYWIENVPSRSRIVVAPANTSESIFRDLAANIPGPQSMLLVLLASRRGIPTGRYESPLLTPSRVDAFVHEFGAFFDRDSRASLWIGSADFSDFVVWDTHQFVYCYGRIAAFAKTIGNAGLTSDTFTVPVPHTHHFHSVFDDTEEEIFARFTWRHSPLQDGDE